MWGRSQTCCKSLTNCIIKSQIQCTFLQRGIKLTTLSVTGYRSFSETGGINLNVNDMNVCCFKFQMEHKEAST